MHELIAVKWTDRARQHDVETVDSSTPHMPHTTPHLCPSRADTFAKFTLVSVVPKLHSRMHTARTQCCSAPAQSLHVVCWRAVAHAEGVRWHALCAATHAEGVRWCALVRCSTRQRRALCARAHAEGVRWRALRAVAHRVVWRCQLCSRAVCSLDSRFHPLRNPNIKKR